MSTGRIGNTQLLNKLQFNISKLFGRQEKLFEQISSNKRLQNPSDDPVATSQLLKLKDQSQRLGEYEEQISEAQVWTNISNAALDDTNSTWKRINEIAISAADGTKSSADRAGMAEELEQLLNHLVQTANTTHGGRYVFGGSKTGSPPFVIESNAETGRISGVFYKGDSAVRNIKTKDEGNVAVNQLGSNAGDPDRQGVYIDSRTDLNMFSTAIQLRDKLLANDIVGISGSQGIIESIEKGAQSIITAQVRIGGTQEALDLDNNSLFAQSSEVEQSLSKVQEADIAKLILELNNAQNTYEAALAASGRLLQSGLLNYI